MQVNYLGNFVRKGGKEKGWLPLIHLWWASVNWRSHSAGAPRPADVTVNRFPKISPNDPRASLIQ